MNIQHRIRNKNSVRVGLKDVEIKTERSIICVLFKNNWFNFWTNFGFIVAVLIAIAIPFIIMTVLISKYYPQTEAFYRNSCDMKPCMKNLGLMCTNGFCLCDENSYYLKGCKIKRDYMQSCISDTNACNDNANLICINGVCQCDNLSYWNGQSCLRRETHSGLCKNSNNECLSQTFLYCDSYSGRCLCPIDR